MRWMKDNVKAVRRAGREKRLLFGTADSWIVWVSAYSFVREILFVYFYIYLYNVCTLKIYRSFIDRTDFVSSQRPWRLPENQR